MMVQANEKLEKELTKYITRTYSSLRSKSKRRGHECLWNKYDLKEWLLMNGIKEMLATYIQSDFDKNKRPSIDRIDDFKGYIAENMQLITWRENLIKGVNSKKHKAITAIRNKVNFSKTVYQYNKKGELIGEYSSVIKASISTGIHKVDIARVCTKVRKTSHGYVFSYVKLKDVIIKRSKLSKPVNQFDLNGIFIRQWDSISSASEELNLNPSAISKACKGVTLKTTGGFKWEYALTGKELKIINK